MRCLILGILACIISVSYSTGASVLFERLESLLVNGRVEFKLMQEICDQNPKSEHCAWSQWRIHEIEQKITEHPAFPRNYHPTPLKRCLYASMVACSLLGGPDPAEQGLSPLSALSGQELSGPLEHYRKNASESGGGHNGLLK